LHLSLQRHLIELSKGGVCVALAEGNIIDKTDPSRAVSMADAMRHAALIVSHGKRPPHSPKTARMPTAHIRRSLPK
jgi:hypothetical protein